LFIRGCLPFTGDPAALRQWADGLHLKPVPEPARSAFLHRAKGAVFDASSQAAKLVLVSLDDGSCSVITDRAADAVVAQGLEAALREVHATFRMVTERADPMNPDLHHREYLAALGKRAWRILAATVTSAPEGRAMITAAPE
jgi:hypothetical protein